MKLQDRMNSAETVSRRFDLASLAVVGDICGCNSLEGEYRGSPSPYARKLKVAVSISFEEQMLDWRLVVGEAVIVQYSCIWSS